MKNKGFTLVELLAVLVLVAALTLIAVPSIINYVNESKDEISDATQKLIYSGAELYIDSRPNEYEKEVGNRFCVTLQDIVDAKYLTAPILDSVSGEEIDLNKFVKINYIYDNNLEYSKFDYEIVDTCDVGIKCTIVSGDKDTFGSEVDCAGERFNIIPQDETNHAANENTISLLAQYNLNVGDNTYTSDPEGIQSKNVLGVQKNYTTYGNVAFATRQYWLNTVTEYPSFVYNLNSSTYQYVNNYKKYLDEKGIINIFEATLMSYEQGERIMNLENHEWLFNTTFLTGSLYDADEVYYISTDNDYYDVYYNGVYTGVRPVIIVYKARIEG